jgi:hypothetical protein
MVNASSIIYLIAFLHCLSESGIIKKFHKQMTVTRSLLIFNEKKYEITAGVCILNPFMQNVYSHVNFLYLLSIVCALFIPRRGIVLDDCGHLFVKSAA